MRGKRTLIGIWWRHLQTIHSFWRFYSDCKITFILIPGSIHLPEHDAVDLKAKQATSLPRIRDNSPLPGADFKDQFCYLFLGKWNLWWQKQTNKNSGDKNLPSISHPPQEALDVNRLLSLSLSSQNGSYVSPIFTYSTIISFQAPLVRTVK